MTTDPKVAQAAEKVVDEAADAIKTAARAPKQTDPKAPKAPTGKVKSYKSDRDVYVDNRYYKAGEVFVTNAIPADHWDTVTPKEAAAITASVDRVPDDANLEAADKSALQAVAIIKHVNIVGLDKQGLIDAIKAANEPAL